MGAVSVLTIVANMFWMVGFTLSILEGVRIPKSIMCTCRSGYQAYGHLRSRWLFVIGACYLATGVIAMGIGKRFAGPVLAAIGAYYLWRWWRHSKNSRKRLKDRALGVVRETAAGLKVVPASASAGA